jgi:hypothetical protein
LGFETGDGNGAGLGIMMRIGMMKGMEMWMETGRERE